MQERKKYQNDNREEEKNESRQSAFDERRKKIGPITTTPRELFFSF